MQGMGGGPGMPNTGGGPGADRGNSGDYQYFKWGDADTYILIGFSQSKVAVKHQKGL
jgi:hypothetical protein